MALPGLGSTTGSAFGSAAVFPAKPDSKVSGVQIGLNVPYSFGSNLMSGDETLERCVTLGVSAVELRAQPVEAFMGVPAELVKATTGRGVSQGAERQAAL